MLLALGWYALGCLGCGLAWYERTQWSFDRLRLCPTPKVLVISFFGAFFGPITLIFGLAVLASSTDVGRDSWWNRPICRDRASD